MAEAHPIAETAVSLLRREAQGYRLDGEGMKALADALANVEDDQLQTAVEGLMHLAHALESEAGSPQAAYAICEVIEGAPVVDRLKGLRVEESPEKAEETPLEVSVFKAPRRV